MRFNLGNVWGIHLNKGFFLLVTMNVRFSRTTPNTVNPISMIFLSTIMRNSTINGTVTKRKNGPTVLPIRITIGPRTTRNGKVNRLGFIRLLNRNELCKTFYRIGRHLSTESVHHRRMMINNRIITKITTQFNVNNSRLGTVTLPLRRLRNDWIFPDETDRRLTVNNVNNSVTKTRMTLSNNVSLTLRTATLINANRKGDNFNPQHRKVSLVPDTGMF